MAFRDIKTKEVGLDLTISHRDCFISTDVFPKFFLISYIRGSEAYSTSCVIILFAIKRRLRIVHAKPSSIFEQKLYWPMWSHYSISNKNHPAHYNDVIMNAMTSPITSLTIVYSTVLSGTDERKHHSSASLGFVRGIHRWPVNSPTKGQQCGKCFHLMSHHEIRGHWPAKCTISIKLFCWNFSV